MKPNQKLSTKYWVVHDTTSDDILILSLSKNKIDSIDKFIENYMFQFFGLVEDADTHEVFSTQSRFECILIEVKQISLL